MNKDLTNAMRLSLMGLKFEEGRIQEMQEHWKVKLKKLNGSKTTQKTIQEIRETNETKPQKKGRRQNASLLPKKGH